MDDLISRQAAIAYAISGLTREFEGEKWIRVSEVRESLQTMPPAERREGQPSECEYWDDESNFCTLNRPSAERRGRWEDVEHAPNGLLYATCSVCGKRQTVEFTSYCGNCGAKMDLENDEDE